MQSKPEGRVFRENLESVGREFANLIPKLALDDSVLFKGCYGRTAVFERLLYHSFSANLFQRKCKHFAR